MHETCKICIVGFDNRYSILLKLWINRSKERVGGVFGWPCSCRWCSALCEGQSLWPACNFIWTSWLELLLWCAPKTGKGSALLKLARHIDVWTGFWLFGCIWLLYWLMEVVLVIYAIVSFSLINGYLSVGLEKKTLALQIFSLILYYYVRLLF